MRRGARAACSRPRRRRPRRHHHARRERRQLGHGQPTRGSVEEPFAPATGAARLTERAALARFLAVSEGRRTGSSATHRSRRPRRPSTRRRGVWTVKVWSGTAGEIALGKVRGRRRPRARGLDRARRSRGAWRAGASARSAARCSTPGGRGSRSASSSSSGSSTGAGSAPGTRSTCSRCVSFGFSLWFFNRGARLPERLARRAPARLPARPDARGSASGAAPSTRLCRGPSGCSRPSRSSSAACASASTSRRPRGVIDVGYAGVIGGDRILDGVLAVRPHAGRGYGPLVRPGRLRRRDPRLDPVQRPLRVREPPR